MLIYSRFLLLVFIVASYEVPQTIKFDHLKPFFSLLDSKIAKVKSYSERGLGIQLQKPISAGDSVICIDNAMLIPHTQYFHLSDYIGHFSPIDKLAARILYEKFMAPRNEANTYFHSLPTDISNPYNWPESVKEFFLKFNTVHQLEINLNKTEAHRAFKAALSNVIGIKKDMLRYETYVWAIKLVESRSIEFFDEELKEDVLVLMPLIDITNYWPSPNNTGRSYKIVENGLCLVSFWDRDKGDELFAIYNEYETSHYFFTYGITMYDYNYDFFLVVYNQKQINVEVKLYAKRMSNQLLENICEGLDFSIKFEDFRSTIESMKDKSKIKNVMSALSLYRIGVMQRLISDGKPGIRETRRANASNQEEAGILKFALAIRKTYYNHKEAFEKEFIYTLYNTLFSLNY